MNSWLVRRHIEESTNQEQAYVAKTTQNKIKLNEILRSEKLNALKEEGGGFLLKKLLQHSKIVSKFERK